MKLIIAKNFIDYNFLQKKILDKNPKEIIEVIFTNVNTKIDAFLKKYKKIKEENIVISKIAGEGRNYNTVIDSLLYRIIKR